MKHIDLLLLTAAYLIPLMLAFQLFVDKRKNISRRIMAYTLFINSLVNFLNYLYLVEDYRLYMPVHGIHAAIEFLIFPSIYLYIKSVISPHFEFKREWTHYIPALVMLGLAHYIFYIYTGPKDLLYFLENNRNGFEFEEFKFTVLKVSRYVHLSLLGLQGVLYAIRFIKIPEEYDNKLRNEFSNIENFSINWINKYLLTFAIIVVIGFISYALIPLKGLHHHIVIVVFSVFSAYVSRLGILALRQQIINIDLDEINQDVTVTSDQIFIHDEKLLRKLHDGMTKKQLYLNPEISLTSLAKQLGTNRTYLSSLINQQFGVNFNVYINNLRAEYAQQYLKENPRIKKDELCEIAGFGSISTMKRVMNGNLK